MGVPDHLSCLRGNVHVGQEETVQMGHKTMDLFKIGKGVHQGCIVSCGLFNLYSAHHVKCQAG